MTLNFFAVCYCIFGCCELDVTCVIANTACEESKKLINSGLKLAKTVLTESDVALDIAKGVLTAAQGVVSAAQSSLDLAIGALATVRKTYSAGVDALDALATFALTEIVNIHEMYFKVELSVANGGVFQCQVKGVLMGDDIDLDLDFDIKNPLELAKSLGEQAISGLSKYF